MLFVLSDDVDVLGIRRNAVELNVDLYMSYMIGLQDMYPWSPGMILTPPDVSEKKYSVWLYGVYVTYETVHIVMY